MIGSFDIFQWYRWLWSVLISEMEKEMAVALNKKDLPLINTHLRELEEIKRDIDKAIEAKVPGMEMLKERCETCIDKSVALKKIYFPHEG